MMELPGPGNYDGDYNVFGKNGVAVSIRGKQKEMRDSGIPGPGAYDKNYELTKSKQSAAKIGSSKRTDIVSKSLLEMPGPGNYD